VGPGDHLRGGLVWPIWSLQETHGFGRLWLWLQKAADEPEAWQVHDLHSVTRHGVGISDDEPMVGDSNAVSPGVSIDHPVCFLERRGHSAKALAASNSVTLPNVPQLSCTVPSRKAFEKQPPERLRRDGHMQ
jgi:hypothetical protein